MVVKFRFDIAENEEVEEGALRLVEELLGAALEGAATHRRLELRGVRIGNVPGEWDAPHALTLERLRLSVGGLLGLLSLLQVPQANRAGAPGGLLRIGPLEFTAGFCIKAIEELELSGISGKP